MFDPLTTFLKPLLLPKIWPALYGFCKFRQRLHKLYSPRASTTDSDLDLVFVAPMLENWSLDSRCKELLKLFDGRASLYKEYKNIPKAKAYFFSEQTFLALSLYHNPHLWDATIFVWFTHPHNFLDIPTEQTLYALKQADRIFITCSQFRDWLIDCGLQPEKIEVIGPRADPDRFLPHTRRHGVIGFCSRYSPRKNPDCVLSVIQAMQHRAFLLVGKDWQHYPRYEELVRAENLTIVDTDYSEYPKLYSQMDVFVSPSVLEGGPVPLIESMMCNVVPVVSRVGFAPDIITHGENGFLFDLDATRDEICVLIEAAYGLEADIRATVIHLNWTEFADRLNSRWREVTLSH